jgi:hypothetical protein
LLCFRDFLGVTDFSEAAFFGDPDFFGEGEVEDTALDELALRILSDLLKGGGEYDLLVAMCSLLNRIASLRLSVSRLLTTLK